MFGARIGKPASASKFYCGDLNRKNSTNSSATTGNHMANHSSIEVAVTVVYFINPINQS